MKRSITAMRFRIAAIVLAAMAMVISSPFWHHQHLDRSAFEAAAGRGHTKLQVSGAGDRLSHSPDTCLICLSQHQLNQIQVESPIRLSSREEITSLVLEHLLPVAATLAFDPQARSPPQG